MNNCREEINTDVEKGLLNPLCDEIYTATSHEPKILSSVFKQTFLEKQLEEINAPDGHQKPKVPKLSK